MSTHGRSATPIARKDDWRVALVTLRALFLAASQSVVKERSRRIRRDSARCRPSNEEDDCNCADSHSSSGTTATPRTTSSLTSASEQNGSFNNDSDASLDHVRQWHAVGGRVMNVLRGGVLSDDDVGAVDAAGLPSTPGSFSPASAPCEPSDSEIIESPVRVGHWHAIGGRLINALRDEMHCEDEGGTKNHNWCSVKDRIASAFRRSEATYESEVDSDDAFGQVGWTSVGNRLATVCRGCATGDEVDGSADACDDASAGALLLLGLTHGIGDLHLRDWYAIGTRLAVSCHNYAGWTDGKVNPAVWQLLCTTVFSGRIESSVVAMRHELDALCRGYATMCRSFAAVGKVFDTPCAKEVDVAKPVVP